MGFHHLAFRFVQNQISKIELHDAVETWRKIMKQLMQVSLRRNRLGNLE